MNGLPPPTLPANQMELLLNRVQDYARKEPAKSLAVGLAAGLLVNLLPSRLLTGAARLAAPLVRPALLTLGVIKACELCCQHDGEHQVHT